MGDDGILFVIFLVIKVITAMSPIMTNIKGAERKQYPLGEAAKRKEKEHVSFGQKKFIHVFFA